jgi:hypothetical protein
MQDGDMDMDVLVGDKGTRERYGLMLLNDGGASLTPVLDSGLNGNYGNLPEDSALGICAADLDGAYEDPRTDTSRTLYHHAAPRSTTTKKCRHLHSRRRWGPRCAGCGTYPWQ